MRRLLLSVLTLGLLVLAAGPALAHGALVDGSPGPGDDVATGASSIELEFSSVATDSNPLVAVLDPDDDPVAVGIAVTSGDATVCARVDPLEPGVYTIDYSVASGDGHRQAGRYQFEVSDDGEPVVPGACEGMKLSAPGEARTLEQMCGGGLLPAWTLWSLGGLAVVMAGLVVVRVRADRARPSDDDTDETASVSG